MGEIFNEDDPSSYFYFLQRRQASDPNTILPSRTIANFKEYVNWCRRRSLERRPQSRIVLLDVKYSQAHHRCAPWWEMTSVPQLFFLIREQRWRVFDIRRNDLVGMFVSNRIAIETGVYHQDRKTQLV